MFLFAPLQVILAITSTSETVIPTNHKICLFFFLGCCCCCFLLLINIGSEQVSDIMQFPTVYNFPIHLHTCFLIYIDENIHYYAINLSWSNVQFWLPTILIFFCSVCNGWQPNWKPLTTHAFFWMENSYAREVYVINYSFPLSVPKWRLLCLLSFKYFSTHRKNVY